MRIATGSPRPTAAGRSVSRVTRTPGAACALGTATINAAKLPVAAAARKILLIDKTRGLHPLPLLRLEVPIRSGAMA
jgi:hypothetical protein